MKITPEELRKSIALEITEILDNQNIKYSYIEQEELKSIDKRWRNIFIDGKTPQFKWDYLHRNSLTIKGADALMEYEKQWASIIYIFNEELNYGLRCEKTNKLPIISLDKLPFEDIYICHHNMKWTLALPHEHPLAYFCKCSEYKK